VPRNRRLIPLVAGIVLIAAASGCGDQPGAKRASVPRCTVLLIHGGGFLANAPSANQAVIERTGAEVIPVDYPLGSVPRAYSSVSSTARRYRDRRRVVAVGESVGGTIAIWLAAHRRVNAAVSISGPTDLRRWPTRPELDPASYPRRIGIAGQRWKWSPRRVYRGQRPVWQVQWRTDPHHPAPATKLQGSTRLVLPGVGHQTVPRPTLRRLVADAC